MERPYGGRRIGAFSGDTGSVLIYDGDCRFCTSSAQWLARRLPDNVEVVPWQRLSDLAGLGLTVDAVQREAWWIDGEGHAHGGHLAVRRSLIAAGGAWRLIGWLFVVPPTSLAARIGYRVVARNRHRLPGGEQSCRTGGNVGLRR